MLRAIARFFKPKSQKPKKPREPLKEKRKKWQEAVVRFFKPQPSKPLEEWWPTQRKKYKRRWNKHPNKEIALKYAKSEFEYRTGSLRDLTQRTVVFITVAVATLAAYGLLVSANLASATVAKIGVGMTGLSIGLSLITYAPPFKGAGKSFHKAVDWVAVIESDFDMFALDLMRADRMIKPIERYKTMHRIIVPALIASVAFVVVAFWLR